MLVLASASKPRCASKRALPRSQGLGMMNALARSCSERNMRPFSACVGVAPSRRTIELWRDSERSIHHLHKTALFAQNEAPVLRHKEILARFRIGLQARPVSLISRQTRKRDQPPRDVVRSFMREEIANQMSTAARDDAAPVAGVLAESVL